MRETVDAALQLDRERDDVKVIIITGEGERAFAAGAGAPPLRACLSLLLPLGGAN